jgi:hypothetical protein
MPLLKAGYRLLDLFHVGSGSLDGRRAAPFSYPSLYIRGHLVDPTPFLDDPLARNTDLIFLVGRPYKLQPTGFSNTRYSRALLA